MSKQYEYYGNASFEDAYHDCKLVADSIVDDKSFQNCDTGLLLYHMDRILDALKACCKNKKQYVLVSQGIEIFRTDNKEEAETMMNESNDEWYKYCQECADNNERAADNEVFMYEEEL